MYLTYIDEVKHDPKNQPYYWLCGLAIPEEDITSVESELDDIANGYFGCNDIGVDTEFHASFIIHGKGPYKGQDLGGRVELFEKIASVIDSHPNIGRIAVRLGAGKIARNDLQSIAFMYFVERVDVLMAARKSKALLIIDYDAEFVKSNVQRLAAFRVGGTDFAYGRDINNVVDTVHHTQSHHSRLLQLADIYVYSMCLVNKKGLKYPKSKIVEILHNLDNFTFPTKYKYWPSE